MQIKRLFLAEKPDTAMALARTLWPGQGFDNLTPSSPLWRESREKGYIQKGTDTVTWAYGHILRLAEPEEYGEQYKSWSQYIFPSMTEWKLMPIAGKNDQLNIIQKLLAEADEVWHAGDPDREGQTLIDEILDRFHYSRPVKRILLRALDDVSMKRSLANPEDNRDFKTLYDAGRAREWYDWLYGMNMSRAYTTSARKYGVQGTFRKGRVKDPTLGLVVKNDRAIRDFKSHPYFELWGKFRKDGCQFSAQYVPNDSLVNPEGYVLDKEPLLSVKKEVNRQGGTVTSAEIRVEKRNPPLPHSLDTLQYLANKKYGYSPSEVLATVQSLYDKKFVSYPRSSCNYIPPTQKSDAPAILSHLKTFGIQAAVGADPSITGPCWNDKKLEAHHAIIPTQLPAENLSEIEENIYRLIAGRYCLQFYPPQIVQKTVFTLDVNGYPFKGTGFTVLSPGFKAASAMAFEEVEEQKDTDNTQLPSLHNGDAVTPVSCEIEEKKTRAPKRLTEGDLLKAMTDIWKYMDPKNPNRDKLKETKGIGTSATRDKIIQELESSAGSGKGQDACIVVKGNKRFVYPTEFGNYVYDNTEPSLVEPDMTAEMEYKLTEIQHGKLSLPDYMKTVQTMLENSIHYVETKKFDPPDNAVPCPICGKGFLIMRVAKKTNRKYFTCSNPDCVSPADHTRMYYAESNGKPIIVPCPNEACRQHPLIRILSKNGPCWLCPVCKTFYPDKGGKPDLSPRPKREAPRATDIPCPICHKGVLVEHVSMKTGKHFFLCSDKECVSPAEHRPIFYNPDAQGNPIIVPCPNEACHQHPLIQIPTKNGPCWLCPACKTFYPDKDGKPDLSPRPKRPPLKRSENSVSCPVCHKGFLVERTSKKSGKPFFICSDPKCKLPQTGKPVFYGKLPNGKPAIAYCPNCNVPMGYGVGKNGPFWHCPGCNTFYDDIDGKPDLTRKQEKLKIKGFSRKRT